MPRLQEEEVSNCEHVELTVSDTRQAVSFAVPVQFEHWQ
jgi:hypothetical protein